MKTVTHIDSGWTFRAVLNAEIPERDVPLVTAPMTASVPGCVHTDLIALGKLVDPYLDANEMMVQWVGNTEWIYTTNFDSPINFGDRHDIVFEGLDTVARIFVNGALIGETFNMHRTYRFDVGSHLKERANELIVEFLPVRDYGVPLRDELGDRPHNYPEPYNFVRKMASNFGWDWGPNLATAGIWKPVRLESWSNANIAGVRVRGTLDGGVPQLVVSGELQRTEGASDPLTLGVRVADSTFTHRVEDSLVEFIGEVPEAEAWWPRGFGPQALYDVVLDVTDAAGTVLDTMTYTVGFRNASLTTEMDDAGMSYTVGVNGQDLFIRGANWIPDDCFVAGVGADRYRARIQQALDANINLLRVWGGGIYEKDEFYAICDEVGMMVSQDFLFACAAYPEEQPVWDEVEAEAIDNIGRLVHHPSLVLWNGSNENIWGYFDWGWQEPLGGSTWGLAYYTELLPTVLGGLDPSAPYWASSPYSGSMDIHPNDPDHGNSHLWEVWNNIDYRHYSDTRPRFVSEFGYQGPATWSTIRESLSDETLHWESAGMLHHQKARDGNGKLERGMRPHLPVPTVFDDWHYLTQLNQARAVSFGIVYLRSLRPHCMGAIVWQLNDCWPVTSWAAIDGKGRKKPLWYALREAYSDTLLTIQPDLETGLDAVLVNDGSQTWQGELTISRVNRDGDCLAMESVHVDVPPQSSTRIAINEALRTPDIDSEEVLLAEIDTKRVFHPFVEDVEFDYRPASYVATAKTHPRGLALTVKARTFMRDIVVNPDRVDPSAESDEQLVTLLPGESHTFLIRTTHPVDDPRWLGAPVIRCVNDHPMYGLGEAM